MKKVVILTVTLLITSCGTSEDTCCEAGPCYLAGSDYTAEEARALTEVTDAMVAAGFTEPGFAVKYIHSPDAPFKNTTWKKWRTGGIPPTDPAVGYGGWCDRPWCMVFINRCGSKEPYLYQLLVHELMHAVGFDHGPAMERAEAKVWEHIQ